jgi:predicted nucleic acid-binding Zn ribbon protein
MGKMCLTHASTPAAVMCFQCHKPICRECVIMTSSGSFCSMECDLTYRTFKTAVKQRKSRAVVGMMGILAVLLILVIGFFVVVHMMADDKGSFGNLDIIGKVLRLFRR